MKQLKGSKIEVTPAPEILGAAINNAIAPMREELRTAAHEDLRLAAEAEKYHPSKARTEWQRLHDRALDGDEAAAAEITKHGGLERYVETVSAPYHLREGMRKRHAEATAGLFQRVVQAVIPAVREAGGEIQRQFTDVTEKMGELPGGITMWDQRVRAMVANFEKLPEQALLGTGAAYLLRESGLGEAAGI